MKVKDLSLFSVLLMFLFVLGMAVEAQAQPPSQGTACSGVSRQSTVFKLCDSGTSYSGRPATGCPDETIAVVFESQYCTTPMIPLAVYCVNLEQYIDYSGGKKPLVWPTDLDPVHLQYQDVNGSGIVTPAITSWESLGDYDIHGVSYSVYKGEVMIPLSNLMNINICSKDPNQQTLFNLSVELVTFDENGNLGTFPLSDYGGPDDIFSCKVFTENCNLCSDAGSDCTPRPPIDSLSICFDCSDCEVPNPEQPNDPEGRADNRMASTFNANQVSINPNPFSDFLEYKYTSKSEEQITVNLVSIDGSLVLQEIKKVGIGENNFILDTSHLVQGLYFLQINSGSDRILQRLTKMD